MCDTIEQALDAAGHRYRLVDAGLIAEMARSLAQLRDRGIMPTEIYEEYSKSLACVSPEGMEVRSLIVVAAPSPPLKAVFDLGGRQVEAVIPPTYVSSGTRTTTLGFLRGVLEPAGCSVKRLAVPAKLLAVRVGLAEYGRNGLAYVEGLGSFARLDVYATDTDLLEGATSAGLDAPERIPVPPPRMRACLSCAWCYHACPTGCISTSGDRIDPLRCLTYLNEHEGEWPATLGSGAHNSLVGCMVCQLGCRVNQELVPPATLITTFDREETEIILKDLPEDELPEGLREKLASIDLAEYSTVLGRNLRALAGV